MRRIFILSFLVVLSFVFTAGAESTKQQLRCRNGDFLLEIHNVGLADSPDSVATSVAEARPQALNLRFVLLNLSQVRKVNGVGKLTYSLSDEFANQYQLIEPVAVEGINPGEAAIDSMYPGQALTENVFFEPPIDQTKTLIFEVTAEGINSGKPFRLEIPQTAFRGTVSEPQEVSMSSDENLTITFPPDGGLVRAGEDVMIHVQLSSGLNLPDTILIMSPNYTFEDTAKAMQYNVHIPHAQPPGPFPIIVLARWGSEAVGKVVSKTITLQVMEKSKAQTTQ